MFNLYLDDTRSGPSNDFGRSDNNWHEWVVVRSVANAKVLLETGLVQDLSLDHDLGCDSNDTALPNGKDLVLWMVECGCWPKGDITIHSNHYTRAKEMKELVDQYYYAGRKEQ